MSSQSFTAQQFIQAALEQLGVYAPGEIIAAADSARALYELNKMLDEWASQYIFVNQLTAVTGNLTTAKSSYKIGINGATDVTVARPQTIQYGPGEASVTVSSATTPVDVVSAIEWASIYSVSQGNGTPDKFWYDNQYPAGVLNVAPTPSGNGTFTCYGLNVLTSFASLSTSVILSSGTQEAIQSNLAVQLKNYFTNANLDPVVAAKAVEGKRYLRYQSITSRAMFTRMEKMPALAGGGQPGAAA